ncbi:hypothetical protein EVAR_74693_1 [Eumeta japonica]|uniref:Uncharacterized protein n=1 Tax=Eumeta variegata TaxID=151549 RepID=A0A4C1YIJ9_EUMVA|nr:hypothetical protein EVAR_74693_1 [Eumeta japonica]
MTEDVQEVISDGDGSLFSTFDIIMLVGLLGGAVWWLYNSRKDSKKDDILLSKYSIQKALYQWISAKTSSHDRSHSSTRSHCL